MGYYTSYSLKWEAVAPVKANPDTLNVPASGNPLGALAGAQLQHGDLDSRIARYIKANGEMFYCLEPDGSTRESGKWYEWDSDMAEMSKEFPGVLFTLSGEGEESDDIWRAYFLDGKTQVAKAQVAFAPCEFNIKKR